MSVPAGTRLGPYEIIAAIGAGGMGEVYRARDTKLNRDVALKILPDAFANDPDRLARFTREAHTLASLNHPNIAAIYGLESNALVMELVEGRDLSELIAGAPALQMPDALAIARQIADALEAAHEQGIIHRDLKPANVKVRADGTVKVLDFGLAKATDPGTSGPRDSVNSPTMLSPAMTEIGMILGTASYMSPEQAKGRAVDKRADIWAFGVVLYEMLAGRPLFDGDSVAETIGLVATRDPDWTTLPASTSAGVRRLLARCLTRDPKHRLRDIGEARILLEAPEALTQPETSAVTPARTRILLWAASLAVALAIGAAVAWSLSPSADVPVRHFEIQTPDRLRAIEAVVSPDGRMVAFASGDKAWIQRLDEGTVQEIPGAASTRILFWSPDSAFLGYQVRGHLWKVAATGGAPFDLGPVPRDFSAAGGAVWLPDDRIWYTTGGSGLLEISVQGGSSRAVLEVNASTELDVHEPSLLPDGKGVLFIPHPSTGTSTAIERFDGRERHPVLTLNDNVRYTAYSPSGHILFRRGSGVWAIKFSLSDLKTAGDPFLVAPDATRPSVSDDGTLVVVPEGASTDQQLTWADRTGRVLSTLGRSAIPVRHPRLSPDGTRVVATMGGANTDVYIFNVARGTDRRLTFETEPDTFPVWSGDGKFVVYQCGQAVCARPADGSGGRVVMNPGPASVPTVSPDDKYLLFSRDQAAEGTDLFVVPLGPEGFRAPPVEPARPFVVARSRQGNADISPDGKFAAYESSDSGEPEIYITSFPGAEGKWQVSRSGGGGPRWSRAGDKIFYQSSDRIFEVAIERTPAPAPGEPVILVSGPTIGARISPYGFERSLDGTRLLFPRSPLNTSEIGAVRLIEQWARAHKGK